MQAEVAELAALRTVQVCVILFCDGVLLHSQQSCFAACIAQVTVLQAFHSHNSLWFQPLIGLQSQAIGHQASSIIFFRPNQVKNIETFVSTICRYLKKGAAGFRQLWNKGQDRSIDSCPDQRNVQWVLDVALTGTEKIWQISLRLRQWSPSKQC